MKRQRAIRGLPEPTWYKDAIIYELRTRSFYDWNGDGIGDFAGLTEKLDYLQDLGVTAIWLLPFYPSPGRDDGYDISDYTDVHPDVGTLADFEALRRRSAPPRHPRHHRAGPQPHLRPAPVVPARAPRARRASPERDFYVWATRPIATARRASSSRTSSPRTGRGIARRTPTSGTASTRTSRISTSRIPPCTRRCSGSSISGSSLGVDGLRLDAVPYLYEEEGTNCENLPETHAFLQEAPRARRREIHEPHAARRGQPVAGRRRRVFRQTATSAT